MKVAQADFERHFRDAIGDLRAAKGLPREAPPETLIELSLFGKHLVSFDEAMERLYIDADRFYRIIDVVILPSNPLGTRFFVRAGAHEPTVWSQTWAPTEHGPFKVMAFT